MSIVSSRGIFLSYRREDAAPYALFVYLWLRERLPDVRVFMDLDSIEAGADFAEVIREAVDSCAVLVALIGDQWVTLADEQGCRRLDNPEDFVRFEVQAALEREVPVVPVLVGGARPLRQEQLPVELRKLARLNAIDLSHDRYAHDADRLVDLIRQALAVASSTAISNAVGPAVQKEPGVVQEEGTRAIRVLVDAIRVAESITDVGAKASALADVATVLAATDPDGAEHIARSITDKGARASVLARIAGALAATDPDRAERFARSITDETWKARALADIARALAATDPDRAERFTQSITDKAMRASVLADIARALAATDPDRAERIAQSITNKSAKASVLAHIAMALSATGPDRGAAQSPSPLPTRAGKQDARCRRHRARSCWTVFAGARLGSNQ